MIVVNCPKYYKPFFVICLSFALGSAFGQKCQTTEIKITYADGVNVFEVCVTNPVVVFDVKREYSWYSDVSGSPDIRRTEGGCGGSLLNGKERFFDKGGHLLIERNYNLGLLDGESKYWESTGKLKETYQHANGDLVYKKVKITGGWFEEIGLFLEDGYAKRYYDESNTLTSESSWKNNVSTTKNYFKYGKKIESQYFTLSYCDTCYLGRYSVFYENGKKMIDGRYSDSLTNVKVGIWKFYKENGTLENESTYKEEIQRWPNGKWKVVGGYYLDKVSMTWLKTGKWNYSDESGRLLSSKMFDFDVEVNNR